MIRAKTMFVVASVCVYCFCLSSLVEGLFSQGGFSRNNILPGEDEIRQEAEISGWQRHRHNFSKVNLGLTPSTQCYIIRKAMQCVCTGITQLHARFEQLGTKCETDTSRRDVLLFFQGLISRENSLCKSKFLVLKQSFVSLARH